MVGRNGIFYDRKGRDWDATITKIVDNPISLRQAFWSPYKKFVRMIEEQVAKRAAAAEAASTARLAGTAEGAAFSRGELDSLLELASGGLAEIMALQVEMVSVPPSPRGPGR